MIEAGRKPKDEDIEPEIHPYARFVAQQFLDVNLWRQPGGFGPAALTFIELDGYCKWYKVMFSLWELKMIKQMDNIYLKWSSKKND